MTNTKLNNFEKNILLPIAILFSTFALQNFTFYIPFLIGKPREFDVIHAVITVCWLGFSILLWKMKSSRNRKLFYYFAIAACLVFIFINFYHFFLSNTDFDTNILNRVIYTFTNFSFLLLVFLLFPYRKHFLTDQEINIDILPFFGTLHIIWGISIIIEQAAYPSFAFSFLLLPGFYIIVGIGLLARDVFFGLFGTFVRVGLIFFYNFHLFQIPDINGAIAFFRILLFPSAVIIILLILRKGSFKRNSFAHIFDNISTSSSTSGSYSTYSASKSCSRCGRQVSLSSTAGQTCPHCGAYWSTEHTSRNY